MLKQVFRIAILGLTLISTLAFAKDIKVGLQLVSIKPITLAEKRGDEIYFSVTEYTSEKKPGISTRVPEFPLHWLSKNLDKVKDIKLWSNTIKENAAVQLVVSLVEQDVPPWNIDDHFGSVKITLVNDKGELKETWSMPDYNDGTKVTRNNQDNLSPNFTFRAEGAEYKAKFKLITN